MAIQLSLLALALQTATPAVPADTWRVDWAEDRCTLLRTSAAGRALGIRLPGTQQSTVLLLTDPHWVERPFHERDPVEVVFRPAGQSIAGVATAGLLPGKADWVVEAHFEGHDLLGRFATAEGIELRRKGETLSSMSFAEAGPAIEALRQCNRDLLREWGIDPEETAAIASWPKPLGNPGEWVTDAHYPSDARRAGAEGRTRFRVDVDARGRVAGCTIVTSAGHGSLDARVCQRLKTSTKFRPAKDAAGRSIPAFYIGTIVWRLPG